MSPKFVVLCTLAVGAIYASGYSITTTSTQALASTAQSDGSASAKATQKVQPAKKTTKPVSKKSSAPAVNTKDPYLDGTYSGAAQNRIGSVAVSVSIKNGKIGNVQITACDTHYPEGYIDPVLPNYVVDHQTTQIPVISGATLSTEDFYYATVEALSKAKNPNYKG